MGPLFSGLVVILFGGLFASVVLAIAAIAFKVVGRPVVFGRHVAFALIEAFVFLLGTALGVAIQIPILGSGATLKTPREVLIHLGIVASCGCFAAVGAGRIYWKLTSRP